MPDSLAPTPDRQRRDWKGRLIPMPPCPGYCPASDVSVPTKRAKRASDFIYPGTYWIPPVISSEFCETVSKFVLYVRDLNDEFFVLHEFPETFKLLIRPKNTDGSLVELYDDIYRYEERFQSDHGYVLLNIRKDGRMFEAKHGVKYARLDSFYCGELGIRGAYRLLADANKNRIHHGWSKDDVLVMPPFPEA